PGPRRAGTSRPSRPGRRRPRPGRSQNPRGPGRRRDAGPRLDAGGTRLPRRRPPGPVEPGRAHQTRPRHQPPRRRPPPPPPPGPPPTPPEVRTSTWGFVVPGGPPPGRVAGGRGTGPAGGVPGRPAGVVRHRRSAVRRRAGVARLDPPPG